MLVAHVIFQLGKCFWLLGFRYLTSAFNCMDAPSSNWHLYKVLLVKVAATLRSFEKHQLCQV